MNRILTVLSLAVILAVLPLSAASAKSAKFISVSGEAWMIPTFEYTFNRSGSSNNGIFIETLQESWEGDITGFCPEFKSQWVVHNMVEGLEEDCRHPVIDDGLCMGPETWLNIHEIFTLENATIGDYEGTLTIMVNVQTRNGTGSWVILHGSGDFKTIHGGGIYSTSLDMNEPARYEGQVLFVP